VVVEVARQGGRVLAVSNVTREDFLEALFRFELIGDNMLRSEMMSTSRSE